MKFSCVSPGQLGLLLTMSVLITACNPEEYYPIEELVKGADAFCYQEGKNLDACLRLADKCQPSYFENAAENAEPQFAVCVANPDMYFPPNEVPHAEEPSSGSPSDDQSTAPGNSNPDRPQGSTPKSPQTIEEAFRTKCADLDPMFLWIKHETKKNKIINTTTKVKICHFTGNGSAHTIIVACPALKAHSKHNDYLGACDY